MPTGYTHILTEREVSFEEFAWRCARAFGAFVRQRDESMNSPPIVEQQSDTEYCEEQLAKARARLDAAKSMGEAEADQRAVQAFEESTKWHSDGEAECKRKRAAYEAMLAKVEAWKPPTKEHEPMKKFMMDQIRSSIGFDCYRWDPPKKRTGAEWLAEELRESQRDVEHYEQAIAEERERTAKRNAWVAALVASVGVPPESPTP